MVKSKNKEPRARYRLFLAIVDKERDVLIDSYGRKMYPTKWVESLNADFGSINAPNSEILKFRLEPIVYEDD